MYQELQHHYVIFFAIDSIFTFYLYVLGLSLGALSSSRTSIGLISAHYMTIAITIAVRYSAVRKQFGPTDDDELPVIEYQTQVYISGIFFMSNLIHKRHNYDLREARTF